MNFRKYSLLVLLILLFIASGFFRDFVFLNVNAQMRASYYLHSDTELSPSLKFLETYSYMHLYYVKWALTFLFSLLFMAYTVCIIRLYFPEKKYVRWGIITYSLILGVAALFWTGGLLANHSEKGYLVARFLMDMTQSPVMLIVLIPALRLLKRENTGSPA